MNAVGQPGGFTTTLLLMNKKSVPMRAFRLFAASGLLFVNVNVSTTQGGGAGAQVSGVGVGVLVAVGTGVLVAVGVGVCATHESGEPRKTPSSV